MTDANTIAQRQRTDRGKALEDVVETILNVFLPEYGLVAVKGTKTNLLRVLGERAAHDLIDFSALPVKRRCTQTALDDYPDSDVFILATPANAGGKYRLVSIVSCKTSMRERYTQVCFWGAALRASSYIRYVFVTADANIYAGSTSELGDSCDKATKARRMLESYTDGVYLIKLYDGPNDQLLEDDIERKFSDPAAIVFDDPSQQGHTTYCHLVRPLDALIDDLRRWKQDVPV